MRKWIGLLLLLVVFPAAAQDTTLQAGERMTVTVYPDAPADLRFSAQAGDVVTITASAVTADFDPVLVVLSPQMRQLAYNDDTHAVAADGIVTLERDARLVNLRLMQTGTYVIRVDSFNGVSEGEVSLLLTAADPFTADVTEEAGNIRVAAALPEDAVYQYSFSASAGDTVRITGRDTSGTLDPQLSLRQAGRLLAFNDDHATPDLTLNVFDARIEVEIPADGLYTVTVNDFIGSAGTFLLEICINTAPCP